MGVFDMDVAPNRPHGRDHRRIFIVQNVNVQCLGARDVHSRKHARSVLVPRHRRQTPRLIRRRVGVGRRVPHHRRVEKRAKSA